MRCKSCNHTNPISSIRRVEMRFYESEVDWEMICEKCGSKFTFTLPPSPFEVKLRAALADGAPTR